MKRCLQTLAVSFAFLLITSLVGYFARFIPLDFWWVFGIASGILVLGAVVAIVLRKRQWVKIVTIFVNAVAMGFYLRSWYINRGFDNPLWLIVCMALLASAYLFVVMLLATIPKLEKYRFWFSVGFVLLSIVGYILILVLTDIYDVTLTWVSTLGYFGLIQIGFALSLTAKEDNKLSAWQWSSYTVLLCAVIILIIALGGDGLDGLFDGLGSVDSPSKKKGDKSDKPFK